MSADRKRSKPQSPRRKAQLTASESKEGPAAAAFPACAPFWPDPAAVLLGEDAYTRGYEECVRIGTFGAGWSLAATPATDAPHAPPRLASALTADSIGGHGGAATLKHSNIVVSTGASTPVPGAAAAPGAAGIPTGQSAALHGPGGERRNDALVDRSEAALTAELICEALVREIVEASSAAYMSRCHDSLQHAFTAFYVWDEIRDSVAAAFLPQDGEPVAAGGVGGPRVETTGRFPRPRTVGPISATAGGPAVRCSFLQTAAERLGGTARAAKADRHTAESAASTASPRDACEDGCSGTAPPCVPIDEYCRYVLDISPQPAPVLASAEPEAAAATPPAVATSGGRPRASIPAPDGAAEGVAEARPQSPANTARRPLSAGTGRAGTTAKSRRSQQQARPGGEGGALGANRSARGARVKVLEPSPPLARPDPSPRSDQLQDALRAVLAGPPDTQGARTPVKQSAPATRRPPTVSITGSQALPQGNVARDRQRNFARAASRRVDADTGSAPAASDSPLQYDQRRPGGPSPNGSPGSAARNAARSVATADATAASSPVSKKSHPKAKAKKDEPSEFERPFVTLAAPPVSASADRDPAAGPSPAADGSPSKIDLVAEPGVFVFDGSAAASQGATVKRAGGTGRRRPEPAHIADGGPFVIPPGKERWAASADPLEDTGSGASGQRQSGPRRNQGQRTSRSPGRAQSKSGVSLPPLPLSVTH